jgi:hypothetical protein
MATQKKTSTITQLRTITFFKENNLWYLECPEWVERQTKLFRKTHTYKNEEGKNTKYNLVQDFSNPLDDHTKHPDWSDPSRDKALVMDDSFVALLEQRACGDMSMTLDIISYGCVSNTFAHYKRTSIDKDGALYTDRFDSSFPKTFLLKPIFYFLFSDVYPLYIHVK